MGWEDLGHAFKFQDCGLKRGRLTTKYSWSEATYLQHHIWDNPLDSDVGLGHHLVCHAEKARVIWARSGKPGGKFSGQGYWQD